MFATELLTNELYHTMNFGTTSRRTKLVERCDWSEEQSNFTIIIIVKSFSYFARRTMR